MREGERAHLSIIMEPVASLVQTCPQEAGPSLGASLRADWANEEDGGGKRVRQAGAGRSSGLGVRH